MPSKNRQLCQAKEVCQTIQVCQEKPDMISNLPLNVIQVIIDCLPLRDAARMSILSRYWRYKWTMASNLILDSTFVKAALKWSGGTPYTYADYYNQLYCHVINNVLLRQNGPVHKFVLYIPPFFSKDGGDMSQWIECLPAKGVTEFVLDDDRPLEGKTLPSNLFSLVDLTDLSLGNCVINSLPVTFSGFPKLVSLDLRTFNPQSFIIGAHTLELLISSCPSLKYLYLTLYELARNPIICSPRLLSFILSGEVSKFWFEKATNLGRLSLYTGWDWKKETNEFFSILPNLQKLVLGDSFWKIDEHIGYKPAGKLANELTQLTELQLEEVPLDCEVCVSVAVWLISNSPGLQQLRIDVLNRRQQCCGQGSVLKEDDTKSLCLKHVEVNCISGSSIELQLIKLLLARSPNLELMVIKLKKDIGTTKALSLAKDMIRYRRASASAEIILET